MKQLIMAAGLLVTLTAAVFASEHSIHIDHSWARASAPGAPSAGFMMVHNQGDSDDVLLDVTGDFAKKLELHRTQQVDGVMKMMHQKEGIVIPAGETVVFKPGSYHLMFMGLTKNFEVGETYTVQLTFEHAGDITVELPVQTMPTMEMSH